MFHKEKYVYFRKIKKPAYLLKLLILYPHPYFNPKETKHKYNLQIIGNQVQSLPQLVRSRSSLNSTYFAARPIIFFILFLKFYLIFENIGDCQKGKFILNIMGSFLPPGADLSDSEPDDLFTGKCFLIIYCC